MLRTHRFGRETDGDGEAHNRGLEIAPLHMRVAHEGGAGTGTALCAWPYSKELMRRGGRRPCATWRWSATAGGSSVLVRQPRGAFDVIMGASAAAARQQRP